MQDIFTFHFSLLTFGRPLSRLCKAHASNGFALAAPSVHFFTHARHHRSKLHPALACFYLFGLLLLYTLSEKSDLLTTSRMVPR